MQISEIINEIELFAPKIYQESYDNSGVQLGDIHQECTGALITLDITEAVIEEALAKNCNLIIAHHPLIFSGIKSITGKNYVERSVIKAIKNDMVLFAAHTNLDNVSNGVSAKICEKLGLENCTVLSPMTDKLYKLFTYVPLDHIEQVKQSLFAAGAGHIGNYSECSFEVEGVGNFKGNAQSNPFIGEAGGKRENVKEVKLEVLIPEHLKYSIIKTLKDNHPYEEVAFELIALENQNPRIGSGMIGYLPQEMEVESVLSLIKKQFNADCIRHTSKTKKNIKKIAVCGGSGSFLLKEAIRQGADLFLTADFKYHQFFDSDNQIVIADIGHFESEQFTKEIFMEIITKKYSNFAVYLSEINTNPINYYF
ncbi:MAG TPA: Nif3-like dinuclear metal center hexameric protein [Edaphocola sp.]|nr:Nif3-like dinuclear metal center hexameric protein [Edaphocola sp.]